jgi:hypothetical protein
MGDQVQGRDVHTAAGKRHDHLAGVTPQRRCVGVLVLKEKEKKERKKMCVAAMQPRLRVQKSMTHPVTGKQKNLTFNKLRNLENPEMRWETTKSVLSILSVRARLA